MKVTGSRNVAGGNQIAGRGHSDPTVNDAADAAARWGLAKSSGSSRNSASTWAASAAWAVNSATTCAAVCGETPLASYIAARSSNSAAGISINSCRSRASSDFSLSG